MAGTAINPEDLPWESWEHRDLAIRSAVRWKLVFSGHRTPTGRMSMGLAQIAPGGILPLHHHAPAEIYHVLKGEGRCEIEGVSHAMRPGISVFIPPSVRHLTLNTGGEPLQFLFVFPTDSFEDVTYHFDA